MFAAAAIVMVAALAPGDEDGGDPGPSHPAAAAPVPPEATALLGTFRRSQAPGDALPHGLREDLRRRGDARPGEDPARSRRLRVPGGPAFVWPASTSVCYATTGPQGCMPYELLRDEGAGFGTAFSSQVRAVRVFALVRDGVRSIRFRLADGSRVDAQVRDNAVQVQVGADPVEAVWRNVDGRRMSRRQLVQRPTDLP